MVKAFDAVAVTVIEPPKLTDDPLMVIELLVSAELSMLLSVPPSVRLPVVVTVPVKVRPLTVPAPATEVTVPTLIEPPKLTDEPLIVMALLVRLELPMFDSVLLEPEMVLLVSVWLPDKVATTDVSMLIVPVDVIGPPNKPVPVSTSVTPPEVEN